MLCYKTQQISTFSVTFMGKLLLLPSVLHATRKNVRTLIIQFEIITLFKLG
jgi:hypothetical protein